ncbi:TMhelix containing protein [Vibrio phage 1.123.O._10N.286.48.F3]|nr:TMhelix containing protein [Vibrio phage 1.123.O._10N.286.48.F3]
MLGVDVNEQSFQQARGAMNDLESDAMDMVTTLGQMGAALLGGAALLNQQTREANSLAEALDVNVKTLENFTNAMRGTEFTMDNVADLYEELTNKIGESKGLEETAPVIEALTMLKLSFADLQKMDVEGQMEAIMNAAIGLGDAQVARSATDILLGAEANKIVGHLRSVGGSFGDILDKQAQYNMLSDEGRKGAIESASTVSDLMTIFSSLAKEISGLLGQAFNPMLEGFRDWIAENKTLIGNQLPNLIGLIKGATMAFGLLFGTMALTKVAAMVGVIGKLITTIRTLGIVALAANVMAAAIPIAIGAAVTAGIAAFALLVEDIMAYFNGDKSVTALIVNSFTGAWDSVVQYAMDKFTMLKNWMADLVPDWMQEDINATNARLGGGSNFGAMGSVAGQAALQASYGGNTYQYNFNGYNGSDIENIVDKNRRKNNAMTVRQLSNGAGY